MVEWEDLPQDDLSSSPGEGCGLGGSVAFLVNEDDLPAISGHDLPIRERSCSEANTVFCGCFFSPMFFRHLQLGTLAGRLPV
jgi:hypothetical protein